MEREGTGGPSVITASSLDVLPLYPTFESMDQFLTFLENTASRDLTHRKQLREYKKAQPRTLLGEVWSWVDALLFAIFWVIIINQYLFQLFVCVQKFVAALFQFFHVFLDRPVFAVYGHGKIEHNEMQTENDQLQKILRRSAEYRVDESVENGDDDVGDGIRAEVDGKHDDVVAQALARYIELGKHEHIYDVIVRRSFTAAVAHARKYRQKDEQHGI